jgi:hypothetical protein
VNVPVLWQPARDQLPRHPEVQKQTTLVRERGDERLAVTFQGSDRLPFEGGFQTPRGREEKIARPAALYLIDSFSNKRGPQLAPHRFDLWKLRHGCHHSGCDTLTPADEVLPLLPRNQIPIMKRSLFSVLSLASFFLAGCGSPSAPAEAPEGGATPTPTPSSAPTDPSKPIAPKAVNAGKKIENPLIDDFEDSNNQGVMADGRGGYWFTYADNEGSKIEPTGSFSSREGGANDSKFSGGMKGTLAQAQTIWAGMGVSFTDPKSPYDASSCKGVSFKGKKNGEGTATVRFKVGDWQTSPEGNLCKQCYNDFGGYFVFTDDWQEYSLLFSDMKQEPYWGEPKAAIDRAALYQVQWQVNAAGAEFDIQVDDVAFIGCE